KTEGVYVFVQLSAESAVVNELARRLTLDDKILRNKVFRPDAK
ncbi:MAG TPA: 30S ribosomal protein S6, partial [Propionibacteriaceae bacterium]